MEVEIHPSAGERSRSMTQEEVQSLRSQICRIHAVVSSAAEAASTITDPGPVVERVQALLAIGEDEAEKILRDLDSAISSHLVAV